MTYTTPRSLQINGRELNFVASQLSAVVGAPVIDETGITGLYDLQRDWTVPPSPNAADDSISIFTAIREQLGLKLERGRGPVEIWVIDSAERPTPD